MNRCSFCEWIPILPWPVWPLAGQFLLGQNVVVGSMMVLLALCGSMPRGVYLGPHFRYKCAAPRLSAELPLTLCPGPSPNFLQEEPFCYASKPRERPVSRSVMIWTRSM